MSLFNHFQRTVKETDGSKLCGSMKEELPEIITQREMEYIQSNLQQVHTKKKRRFVYEEKDKQDVAKYAAQYDTTAAIRKFKHRFPNLNESTVRPWLKKYREDQAKSRVRSLYQTMKFSRRADTTSRPVITRSLWIEANSQFLYDISDKVLLYNIPGELIINADQTPSKCVATDNVTMAAKGEKHISRTGSNDRRSITLTLWESHN